MATHQICEIDELPPGERKIVQIGKRSVGVFNVDGALYAVLNRCPHHGAPLCMGDVTGTMLPSAPGEYRYGLDNAVIQCPRHAYEFELATGQPVVDGQSARCVVFPVSLVGDFVVIDDLTHAQSM